MAADSRPNHARSGPKEPTPDVQDWFWKALDKAVADFQALPSWMRHGDEAQTISAEEWEPDIEFIVMRRPK